MSEIYSPHYEGKDVNLRRELEQIARALASLPGLRGTWTATISGYSDVSSDLIYYEVIGYQVHVTINRISGTSNATTKALTGVPARYRPPVDKYFPVRVSDNGGAFVFGLLRVNQSDGSIDVFTSPAVGTWTNSGTAVIESITLVWDYIAT